MLTGKTIQIFLPDGNPRSLKIAEITSRTVKAILIPRSKIDSADGRPEIKNVGIYFLIGALDEGSKPLLYIGEAEDALIRIKQHNIKKDFWTHTIVVISKTQYFTKTHVKYLEWLCYDTAIKAGRYTLDNSTIPNKPYISESMEADLFDNFDTIKILVATLGYPIFDEIKKPHKQNVLVCKGKDAYAEGEYSEDGLIVFKGGKCNLEETKTCNQSTITLRHNLIHDGILKKVDNYYEFTSDYIFPSPSAAAGAILGRAANGWLEWKYQNGKTLDEVKRHNQQ